MGAVAATAMRRKAITLLAAVSVVLVAFGGAATAAHSQPAELDPANESAEGDADVGICVVGVDSPCNGEQAEEIDGEPANDSEEKMWIPEDQNRDGEIDERFTGNDSDGDCLNGDDPAERDPQILLPEDQNHDGEIDERFTDEESDGDELQGGNVSDGDGQLWIPEDQNRDGEIDDRFTGEISGVLSGLLALF